MTDKLQRSGILRIKNIIPIKEIKIKMERMHIISDSIEYSNCKGSALIGVFSILFDKDNIEMPMTPNNIPINLLFLFLVNLPYVIFVNKTNVAHIEVYKTPITIASIVLFLDIMNENVKQARENNKTESIRCLAITE